MAQCPHGARSFALLVCLPGPARNIHMLQILNLECAGSTLLPLCARQPACLGAVHAEPKHGHGATKTLCPSGLRGWTQVPLARAAWVQIPQVSIWLTSLPGYENQCHTCAIDWLQGGETRSNQKCQPKSSLTSQTLCLLSDHSLANRGNAAPEIAIC